MADYFTNDTDLTAVANAIRTKGGTTAPLEFPDGYVQAIGDIETSSDLTALSLPSLPFTYTFNGQYTVASQGATYQPSARTFPYLETPVYGKTYKYVVSYGDSPSYYNQIERTFVYNGPQVFTYSSGAQLTVGAAGLTLERTTAFSWTAVILLKDAGTEGYSSVSARGITCTNLVAENIKKGVTVSVGDTNLSSRITSVVGTYEGSAGEVHPGILRPDATLVHTWADDYLAVHDKGITLPAYSTSNNTIVAADQLGTAAIDLENNWPLLTTRVLLIPIYSDGVKSAGRQDYYWFYSVNDRYKITPPSLDGTANSLGFNSSHNVTQYGIAYWTSDSVFRSAQTITYGIYTSSTSISVGTNEIVAYHPAVRFRGAGTYLNSQNYAKITDIRIQYIIELWKIPYTGDKPNGGSLSSLFDSIIYKAVKNNGGKLT